MPYARPKYDFYACYYCNSVSKTWLAYVRHLRARHPRGVLWREALKQGQLPVRTL